MRIAFVWCLLIAVFPAWADRAVDMGTPQLSGIFVGPHAADCVDQAQSARTDQQVSACFDKNLDAVMQIWQRALKRDHAEHGRISLRLRITADGVVQEVGIVACDPGLDQQLQQELLTAVKAMDFRKAANIAEVSHTFNLVPQ